MISNKYERTDVIISDVDYTDMMPDDPNWNCGLLNWWFYCPDEFKLLIDMSAKNCYLGNKVLCCFEKANPDLPLGVLVYIELDQIILVSVLEVNSSFRRMNVGTIMIDELKLRNKMIALQSLDKAAPFYKKLGFKCELDIENCKDMKWIPGEKSTLEIYERTTQKVY